MGNLTGGRACAICFGLDESRGGLAPTLCLMKLESVPVAQEGGLYWRDCVLVRDH